MLRTKLSLNAEKNWHQNSGAKRREVIRERNMKARVSWRLEQPMDAENPRRVKKANEFRYCRT